MGTRPWIVVDTLYSDRSRHGSYLKDEKTHSAIKNKPFKRLKFFTDQLYEDELVKLEIQHREPIIVGFFNLQLAKLRMLGRYYNFSNFTKKFSDIKEYEELEMVTDFKFLAVGRELRR